MKIRTIFCLFILLMPVIVSAQSVISGRVIDRADSKPIENASVFISNATIGGKTAANGTFVLQHALPGKYYLVVSIVGYEIYSQPISINGNNIRLPDIKLSRKTIQLKEVKITPITDAERDEYLAWFKKEFLGTTDLAPECTILNPEILNFSYDQKTAELTASTDDFLKIRNEALGYEIDYLLSDFKTQKNALSTNVKYHGYVLFKELKGSPGDEARWQKARQQVYENSLMRYLRAVLVNKAKDEGFKTRLISVYHNPDRPADSLIKNKIDFYEKLKTKNRKDRDSLDFWKEKSKLVETLFKLQVENFNPEEAVQKTSPEGVYALGCESDGLFVIYDKHQHFLRKGSLNEVNNPYNQSVSTITFNSQYAYFDNNGWILNPESITLSGVWTKSRVAGLLPEDYESDGKGALESKIISSPVLSGIIDKLDSFSKNMPAEQAYLQTDKDYYTPYDTVWYKAYLTSGPEHQPSQISKVVFVELIGPQDTVIRRQTLQVADGAAWGDIVLPDEIKEGDYYIRAYTNWMRNFGAEYFYRKRIHIGMYETATASRPATALPDVQFFPEGGELVNGLRSKVAIKALNPDGYGQDVKGTVIDNTGKPVAEFTTQHLGMGVFAFTPDSGKTYTAKITAGGMHFTAKLPDAKAEGFIVAINNSNADSIFLKVAVSGNLYRQLKGTPFYLVGQTGGEVYYTAESQLDSRVFTTSIDKKRFPSGIAQFTLLSQNGEPLNERTIFIQNDDTLKLVANRIKQSAARKKVNFTVRVKNSTDKPASGAFSVSVINESMLPPGDPYPDDIFSSLLLTSNLKGYVEDPGYYFSNENDQTRAGLDALMLTQGYERYDWKTVLTDSLPKPEYQPESSLSLAGNVSFYSGKPVPDAKIILIAPKLDLITDTIADSAGHFRFDGLNLADSAKMTLTAKTIKGRDNVEIHITKPDYPPFKYDYPADAAIQLTDSTGSKPAAKDSINHYRQLRTEYVNQKLHRLNEVTIKAHKMYKRKEPDLSNSDNLNGPGRADQVIMAKDLKGCLHLADCLVGLVRGPIDPAKMTLIIDGDIIHDRIGLNLDDLNANTIHSIEVLRSPSYLGIYGGEAGSAALVITTKRGGDKDFFTTEPLPGTLKYTFKGFYLAHEFYSPKYDHPQTNTGGTDLRSTIYWNPDLVTDKEGKATFDYFNSDTKGVYRVVIEGIDGDGNLGRTVYRYVVK